MSTQYKLDQTFSYDLTAMLIRFYLISLFFLCGVYAILHNPLWWLASGLAAAICLALLLASIFDIDPTAPETLDAVNTIISNVIEGARFILAVTICSAPIVALIWLRS